MLKNVKIALFLNYIYIRKMFVKGDFLAISLLLGGLIFSLVAVYQHFSQFYWVIFLFLISTISHHFSRKDFSLLKNYSSLKTILFLEYFFENLPFLFLFLLKKAFFSLVIYVILLSIISFLPKKFIKIRYPFSLSDPNWHISFRKYKLIWAIPLCIALILIGKVYKNENLAFFSLFLGAFICSIPYFEREFIVHIKISSYKNKYYLLEQIKTGFLNFSFFFSIIFLTFLCCFGWSFCWAFPLFFIIPLTGILTKYAFFHQKNIQNLSFLFILCGLLYGISIIVFPFLYFSAVQNIKKIEKC